MVNYAKGYLPKQKDAKFVPIDFEFMNICLQAEIRGEELLSIVRPDEFNDLDIKIIADMMTNAGLPLYYSNILALYRSLSIADTAMMSKGLVLETLIFNKDKIDWTLKSMVSLFPDGIYVEEQSHAIIVEKLSKELIDTVSTRD